jgi:hypothetical protein
MRGGKLYDSDWGQRMTGTGTLAQLIRQRFDLAARKFEFNKFRYQLDTTLFRVPESMSAKDTRQMSLFCQDDLPDKLRGR